MKSIIIGLLFALVIAIGCNVYFYHKFFKKAETETAYWRNKAFKVDTVFSEKRYSEILKPYYPEFVPPQEITNYVTSAPSTTKLVIDTLGFVNVIDSILRTKIGISREYITQYPRSNKLVYGDFSLDSIRLDLLGINGKITTERYPVDLSSFKYQYSDNSMRAVELVTSRKINVTQKKSKFYDGTYVNYERDFLNKSDKASISTGFNIGKFRLGGFAEKSLNSSIPLGAGAKVGYRLF